jgi:hypothetical protein
MSKLNAITSVKGNLKKLLGASPYASVKSIMKEGLTRKQAEQWLLDNYNEIVDTVKENVKDIKKKEKKAKPVEKKFYDKNVIEYDYKKYTNDFLNKTSIIELQKILKKFKNVIVDFIDNKKIIKSINIEVNGDFNHWWKKEGQYLFVYPYENSLFFTNPNVKLYFYEPNKKINNKKIIQYFKEGNVNCLLKPIINWAFDCKESCKSDSSKKRYNSILNKLNKLTNEIGNNGVCEKNLNKIAEDIQIDISIEKPIVTDNDKYIIEVKANKKALKHFIMRNTKINHVELNEFTYLNNVESVSREQLYNIKKQLDIDNIYYDFHRDSIGYNKISTLEKTYMINNEFNELINEFEIETGLNECCIDDINDYELSKFVKAGTHYNSTIDFKNLDEHDINEVNHIDMKTAYSQYLKCDYFEGFLGKITDFRKTNKIMGVGLYQITNIKFSNNLFKKLNDKLKIYIDNNVYTSAELNYLNDNNVTFDIICGCWGVKPLVFDMCEYPFLFNEYDKIKGYAKYVGMCDSHKLTKKFWCKGDRELASVLDNVLYFDNNEICLSYPKLHNNHKGHITAFITAYQRLNVLNQLSKMNYDNILRVCVDGIYYIGECNFDYPFRLKDDKTFANVADEYYISNIEYGLEFNCGEFKENYQRELHIGAGGNGKSHINLTDKGFIKMLYVAPSWKLATNKKNDYNVKSDVWANILTCDPKKYGAIKKNYNCLLIDEVSMMTEEDKNIIFNKFDNMKLIFCGDIGFQAPPFGENITELTNNDFNNVNEYKINYRFKCDKLKRLIDDIREMIYFRRSNNEVNNYVKRRIKRITDEQLKNIYNVNDMILSRTHEIKDKYTNMFSHLNKWYITKNTRKYQNGCIVIGNKPDTTCEIRHSYTIHSIQGETA